MKKKRKDYFSFQQKKDKKGTNNIYKNYLTQVNTVVRTHFQSFENFQKLQREQAHFSASVAERKKKDKDFGKMLKNFKKGNYGKL